MTGRTVARGRLVVTFGLPAGRRLAGYVAAGTAYGRILRVAWLGPVTVAWWPPRAWGRRP